MIDKKQLINELLECVQDATDAETKITGLGMCAILMNEVLDQQVKLKLLDIADVMDMLPLVTFLEKVNRVEVIDQKGRSYVNWKPINKTSISMQDDGRTLKVFIDN